MTQAKLEERVIEMDQRLAELEAEVSRLSQQANDRTSDDSPWWNEIFGVYKDDPLFDEAERLGREYRENEGAEPDKSAA